MTLRMSAGLVLLAAAVASAARSQGQRPAFRSAVDLVNFGVTVTDRRGNVVATLGEQDFEVYEDGKRQTIRYFLQGGQTSAEEAGPPPELHLGVLLDISGSMENDLRMSKDAAVKFLATVPGANDITLVDFDTEVRIARYDALNYARLIERIRSRRTEGNTALYDAIGVYLDNASADRGRKILVIYTDGGDNGSNISYEDLRQLLRASDVTVYTIGFVARLTTNPRFAMQRTLEEIAEITGGQFLAPASMKDLETAYEKVRAEISAQYSIGYVSSNTRMDGSWRKVEIRLAGPDRRDLRIRTRRGYYAPYREGGEAGARAGHGPSGGTRD